MKQRYSGRSYLALTVLLKSGVALLAQEAALEFTDASLRDWVQPAYPKAAKKTKLEGEVLVEFVVEPDGHVTRAMVKDSSDKQFEAPALAAVTQWVFSPALEEGRPVASAVGATVRFTAAQWQQKQTPLFPQPEQMPQALKLTSAKATFAPDPEYPPELDEQKIAGEVQMEFTVDETGRVRDPKVLWASHPAFVETSLRAVEKTRFEPAHQGPLPKTSAKRYPVSFQSLASNRAEVLAANHLVIILGPEPSVLPQPFVLCAPVYPPAQLIAGDGGTAVIEFTVTERGLVREERLVSATQVDFGHALQAAVEGWSFQPAVNGEGVRVPVRLRCEHKFVPPESGAVARLAADMRPGGAGVSGAAGLDQKLKPLWRGFPVYPANLTDPKPTGEALIEFIIDRDGRVRLPHIKSATQEEFGWAAATAISQWVFAPPRRKGEPVDVRVSIPIEFSPPEQ